MSSSLTLDFLQLSFLIKCYKVDEKGRKWESGVFNRNFEKDLVNFCKWDIKPSESICKQSSQTQTQVINVTNNCHTSLPVNARKCPLLESTRIALCRKSPSCSAIRIIQMSRTPVLIEICNNSKYQNRNPCTFLGCVFLKM